MTGKTLQNEFFNRVLAQNLILELLILKNPRDLAIQISISIFLDHIRARFDVFLDFSRIKLGPLSSRYSPLLLKPHNHHSIALILPYRLSIDPT